MTFLRRKKSIQLLNSKSSPPSSKTPNLMVVIQPSCLQWSDLKVVAMTRHSSSRTVSLLYSMILMNIETKLMSIRTMTTRDSIVTRSERRTFLASLSSLQRSLVFPSGLFWTKKKKKRWFLIPSRMTKTVLSFSKNFKTKARRRS